MRGGGGEGGGGLPSGGIPGICLVSAFAPSLSLVEAPQAPSIHGFNGSAVSSVPVAHDSDVGILVVGLVGSSGSHSSRVVPSCL